MATAGSNNRGSFQRFDGKLDSTLRKTLTLEEYERLSITESCIVVTDDGKRSQKLVTVGHSALYFCNIPPKSVKRILYLTQIISCTTVRKDLYQYVYTCIYIVLYNRLMMFPTFYPALNDTMSFTLIFNI